MGTLGLSSPLRNQKVSKGNVSKTTVTIEKGDAIIVKWGTPRTERAVNGLAYLNEFHTILCMQELHKGLYLRAHPFGSGLARAKVI